MKKATKAILGIGGFLVLAGLLLGTAGWAMGGQTNLTVSWFGYPINVGVSGIGWHAGSSDRGAWQENTDLALGAFTDLDVDVSLGDITVRTGSDYGVELQWRGERYQLHYTNENGLLRVWSETERGIGFISNISYDASATIYLPEGAQLGRVEINTDLGDCDLSGFTAQKLTVDADLGGVALSDVKAEEADLTLNLGDLNIDNVSAETMELRLDLGSLSANDLYTEQSLTVTNSMGDINLYGEFRGVTDLTDNMGSVSVATSLPEREYGYDLHVDMGSISVNGERYRDQLKSRGGNHSLRIENDMGDIDVIFGA